MGEGRGEGLFWPTNISAFPTKKAVNTSGVIVYISTLTETAPSVGILGIVARNDASIDQCQAIVV